jgi:CBS domain-containing protein
MAHLMERTAGEVASRKPRVIAPDQLAAEALGMMSENKITALFVTDAAIDLSGSSACTIACAPVWSEPPGRQGTAPPRSGQGRSAVTGRIRQAQLSSSARRSISKMSAA